MRTMRKMILVSAAVLGWLVAPAAGAQTPAPYPQDYELPPFALPAPQGRYSVGSLSFVVLAEGGEALRVTAWYPAVATSGPTLPYLDPSEQRVQAPAVTRNFGWPANLMHAVGTLPTHSHAGANIATGRFPLIVFSHGFLSYARQNTSLMERLASEGYIILSLAHPGDAADIPTPDGTIATASDGDRAPPDMARVLAFWNGGDHAQRLKAFPGFWEALRGGRMLTSLERWRGDILRLVDAVQSRRLPAAARPLADAADLRKLAYAGMSFGGSASVSACEFDPRCRAAVNLDGFEFDQRLYDRSLRVPLLLVQSDWTAFPNMGPASRDFTVYDYAYERWARAGSTPSIYRYRIAGVKHLGLTDLVLAPHDPVRDRMFGPADGQAVTAATNDLVAAFLDRHVAAKKIDVVAVAARHPVATRHRAAPIADRHRR